MCMDVFVCICLCTVSLPVCAWCRGGGGQKRAADPLELESQTAVRHHIYASWGSNLYPLEDQLVLLSPQLFFALVPGGSL